MVPATIFLILIMRKAIHIKEEEKKRATTITTTNPNTQVEIMDGILLCIHKNWKR